MKLVIALILSALLVFFAVQVWYFYERGEAANHAAEQLGAELKKAQNDHDSLNEDYMYYQNEANLEKELRSRFNYRAPGEKMIVIVPATTTPTTTTP